MNLFVRFWVSIAFVVLLCLFPVHASEFASIYCNYTSGQTMTADGAEELEIGAAGFDGLLVIEKYRLRKTFNRCRQYSRS